MATLPQITRSPEGATGPTHFRTLVPVYRHHTKIENNSFKLCTSTPTTEFLSKVLTLNKKKHHFRSHSFARSRNINCKSFVAQKTKNIPPPPAIITWKQTTNCVTRLSGPWAASGELTLSHISASTSGEASFPGSPGGALLWRDDKSPRERWRRSAGFTSAKRRLPSRC